VFVPPYFLLDPSFHRGSFDYNEPQASIKPASHRVLNCGGVPDGQIKDAIAYLKKNHRYDLTTNKPKKPGVNAVK